MRQVLFTLVPRIINLALTMKAFSQRICKAREICGLSIGRFITAIHQAFVCDTKSTGAEIVRRREVMSVTPGDNEVDYIQDMRRQILALPPR